VGLGAKVQWLKDTANFYDKNTGNIFGYNLFWQIQGEAG